MKRVFSRLKPLLEELDRLVPINEPVLKPVIKSLIEKHSPKKKITLIGFDVGDDVSVKGIHLGLGAPNKDTAVILYEKCGKRFDPACEACQRERFNYTKELIHCFDVDGEKTAPDNALIKLMEELARKRLAPGAEEGVVTDYQAPLAAIEILVRYSTRVHHYDSFRVTHARQSGDFSYLAKQFCVPEFWVAAAFDDRYHDYITAIRQRHGMVLTPYPAAGPQV